MTPLTAGVLFCGVLSVRVILIEVGQAVFTYEI